LNSELINKKRKEGKI